MSSSRSDWPALPDFHPEFGLLCPSPRRRRGLRLVVLSVMSTLAIGATMGLAVAHWPDGEVPASAAQPTDGQPPAGAPDIPASATPRSMSAAGVDSSPAMRLQESCKAGVTADLAAFFLKSTCGAGKLHAKHGARAANRVATVILGRTDAAPAPIAAPAPVAAATIEPSRVKVGNAAKSANLTTAAVEGTAAAKKPKVKASAPIALTPPGRELSRQNAMGDAAMAYASTPRLGRESFDPYGDTFRSTAPRPGFEAPFGWFR
jgi:hypothetical protein